MLVLARVPQLGIDEELSRALPARGLGRTPSRSAVLRLEQVQRYHDGCHELQALRYLLRPAY